MFLTLDKTAQVIVFKEYVVFGGVPERLIGAVLKTVNGVLKI